MAATYPSSCVPDQCDMFLDSVRAKLTCYKEEATMLLSKLGVQEGNCDKNRIRILRSLMEMADGFKLNSSKLCSKKCNLFNRVFCKNGEQFVFVHHPRVCDKIIKGKECADGPCEHRHP